MTEIESHLAMLERRLARQREDLSALTARLGSAYDNVSDVDSRNGRSEPEVTGCTPVGTERVRTAAKNLPNPTLHLPTWEEVLANDRRCAELANRDTLTAIELWPRAGHYPRARRRLPPMKPGARPLGPGFCVLLHHAGPRGSAGWGVVLNRFDGRWFWRNSLYRNESGTLSSLLVETATAFTYVVWVDKYGSLPDLLLRTEIDIEATADRRSKQHEPGHCYRVAGWVEVERRDRYKGRPPTVYLEHPRSA